MERYFFHITFILIFSTALTSCVEASTCIPNEIQGCKVCKPDGSGWLDDNSRCASEQICRNGACLENEYEVGVNYHAIGPDFYADNFLGQYNNPQIRRTVIQQLQDMADEGADIIKINFWMTRDKQTHISPLDSTGETYPGEWAKFAFPPTNTEITNLRQFAHDVASIRAKDGHYLKLRVTMLRLWCADFTMGTPETGLGNCNVSQNEYKQRTFKSIDDTINALKDIKNPDGNPVVETIYLDAEIMIGAKSNQEWFLKTFYPYFVSAAKNAGLNPSIYFLAVVDDITMDNNFIDPSYPALNGHRPLYWIYRSLKFMKDQGLPIPNRIDMSCYLDTVNYSADYAVQRVFSDLRMVLPNLGLASNYPIGVAETWHPTDSYKRLQIGQAFAKEYLARGNPKEVIFWTTPDGGGIGVHVGFPFDIKAYQVAAEGVCQSGTILGCKVCKPDGSGWDTKSKCLNVIYLNNNKEAELMVMQTLQGIVAQTNPEIYINSPRQLEGDWVGGYEVWLDNLKNYGYTFNYNNDPWWYIDTYKPQIRGYILFDMHQRSALVAASLAGVLKAVAIDTSLEPAAKQHGLPLILDVRGKDEHWLHDNSGYWNQLNHDELLHVPAYSLNASNDWAWGLNDYAAYRKLFKFSEPGITDFLTKVMKETKPNSPFCFWGSEAGEGYSVLAASNNNLYTTGTYPARDLSVLSQIKVPSTLKQRSHTDSIQNFPDRNVHYVTFVLSDGDSVNNVLTSLNRNNWYNNSARGQFSMGWEMTPSMIDYAPTVLDWYYRNALVAPGKKDNFVAAGGLDYIYADEYPDINTYARLSSEAMGKADMHVMTVYGYRDTTDPKNPSVHMFDPKKLCDPFTAQPNIDGVVVKLGRDWQKWNGLMVLSNGKPCVAAKENLYAAFGHTTKGELVNRLNSAPRDPNLPEGYSYVNIGPWNNPGDPENMTAISLDRLKKEVIDKLDPNVIVVTPEEFIKLIAKNVYKKSCTPNSVSGCSVCDWNGTGWVDDSTKCQAGQACANGQCLANQTRNMDIVSPESCKANNTCSFTIRNCSNGLVLIRNLAGWSIDIRQMVVSGDFPLTFFSSSPYTRSFIPGNNGTVGAVIICLSGGQVEARRKEIAIVS